jgi:hypothetical protein
MLKEMLVSSANILMLALPYATSTAAQATELYATNVPAQVIDDRAARNGFPRLTVEEENKCLHDTIGPQGGYPNWESRSDDGSWFYPIEGDNE